MSRCQQELCLHWGGDGEVCPCVLFDLPRPSVDRCDGYCHGEDTPGTCEECDSGIPELMCPRCEFYTADQADAANDDAWLDEREASA